MKTNKSIYEKAFDNLQMDEEVKAEALKKLVYAAKVPVPVCRTQKLKRAFIAAFIPVAVLACVMITFFATLGPFVPDPEEIDFFCAIELDVTTSGGSSPKYFCGLESDTNIFDLDDVTVTFFCGSIIELGNDERPALDAVLENVKSGRMVHIAASQEFYARIISGFSTYEVLPLKDTLRFKITIPRTLFDQDKGTLRLKLTVFDSVLTTELSMDIFYSISNGTVTLIASPNN